MKTLNLFRKRTKSRSQPERIAQKRSKYFKGFSQHNEEANEVLFIANPNLKELYSYNAVQNRKLMDRYISQHKKLPKTEFNLFDRLELINFEDADFKTFIFKKENYNKNPSGINMSITNITEGLESTSTFNNTELEELTQDYWPGVNWKTALINYQLLLEYPNPELKTGNLKLILFIKEDLS